MANVLPAERALSPSRPIPADTPAHREREPVAAEHNSDVPMPRPVGRDSIAEAPEPRPSHSDLHAFPAGAEIAPFDFVEARVPFLKPLRDFDHEDIRQEFKHELGLDPAFRIDLFARDPARGVELFHAAARASGLIVFTDALTTERLRKRQTTAVVIYTESLTAAELTGLFAKLSIADAKISPGSSMSFTPRRSCRATRRPSRRFWDSTPGC